MSETVMMFWDCPSCNRKGILGTEYECPSCARPRGKETKFYLDPDREIIVKNHVKNGPDWYCEHCGSYNSAALDKCERCCAPRGSKNYFDFNPDRKGTRLT